MAAVIAIVFMLLLYPIGRGWVLLFVRIARLMGGRIKYWNGVAWSIVLILPLFLYLAFGIDWDIIDYGISPEDQKRINIAYFILGVSAFGWIVSLTIPEESLVNYKILREEALQDALENDWIDEDLAREIVEETWPLVDEIKESEVKQTKKEKT